MSGIRISIVSLLKTGDRRDVSCGRETSRLSPVMTLYFEAYTGADLMLAEDFS